MSCPSLTISSCTSKPPQILKVEGAAPQGNHQGLPIGLDFFCFRRIEVAAGLNVSKDAVYLIDPMGLSKNSLLVLLQKQPPSMSQE